MAFEEELGTKRLALGKEREDLAKDREELEKANEEDRKIINEQGYHTCRKRENRRMSGTA